MYEFLTWLSGDKGDSEEMDSLHDNDFEYNNWNCSYN
jgi:hypothetical protein